MEKLSRISPFHVVCTLRVEGYCSYSAAPIIRCCHVRRRDVLTADGVTGSNAFGLEHLDQPAVVRDQGESVALVVADHSKTSRGKEKRRSAQWGPRHASDVATGSRILLFSLDLVPSTVTA
jgi:hypothetical protein